jgi:Uma2 family endonuclease
MTTMTTVAPLLKKPTVIYPESDGLPLADNTKQFRWIMTIQGGLDAQFADDPNVFVAGNLLWYPVEGDNKTRAAPDVLVAFGRPKGDRGSYQQWLEGNVAPQATFEIVSPSNTAGILTEKFNFFDKYGVEEYYLYDPDANALDGWLRKNGRLTKILRMDGWISPLLGIQFDLSSDDLRILDKTGAPFVATPEAIRQRNAAIRATQAAENAAAEATRAKQAAESAAAEVCERAERLKAQLKALGIEPEA